ncbi:MAG: hypothetical protein Q8R37_05665 [Nanoarchaeota archaeon]|nr:hypothetical protein [Nanoarchaeota archaeon]
MNLETQIQDQLQQYHKNIVIVEKLGPQHYIGIHTDPYHGVTSIPVTYGKEEENWKLVEAEVYNYLVSFKEAEGCKISQQRGNEDLLKLTAVMQGMMEGIATFFNPKPLYVELPLTFDHKEGSNIRCGRLVFMEKIGERKTLTEYTFNNRVQPLVFDNGTEKIEPLYQVVKVTFCPTEEIAKIAAKKYIARDPESIIIKSADLPKIEAPKNRSLFERLFSS